MTHSLRFWWLVLSLGSLAAYAAGTGNQLLDCRGGGEGPIPFFEDISGSLVSSMKTMNTPGGLQDFVYEEGSRSVIYRDSANKLWSLGADAGNPASVGTFSNPLARQVDPDGRFVVADGDSRMMELATGQAFSFLTGSGLIEHLFWNRVRYGLLQMKYEALFSLTAEVKAGGGQLYTLYSYIPDRDNLASCQINLTDDYRLVHGVTNPFVVFYKEGNSGGQRTVTFRRFHTLNGLCNWWDEVTIGLPNSVGNAPLEGAYYFTSLRGTALKMDAPDHNLLWVRWDALGAEEIPLTTPGKCATYNLPNQRPFFLSDTDPVLAIPSADGAGGMTIYYLEKNKAARLLSQLPLGNLDPRSLWFSNAGNRLFVSPPTERVSDRVLLQLMLKPQ